MIMCEGVWLRECEENEHVDVRDEKSRAMGVELKRENAN